MYQAFFKEIAINIWERDMTRDGINFRKTSDYLAYMYALFPIKGKVFGDNVLQYMTLFSGASRAHEEAANTNLLSEVIDDLQSMLDKEILAANIPDGKKEQKSPTNTIRVSMDAAWLRTDQQRIELFEELRLNQFISDGGDRDNFFKKGSVVWIGQEDTDLYFLIAELEREGFISYTTHKHGAIIAAFFKKPSGDSFNEAVARKNTRIIKSRNSDKIKGFIAEIRKTGNNR